MTITLRERTQTGATTKGSALTWAELDANFLFDQSGTGAVTRTVQQELRDLGVRPEQFGAVGDGVTNDAPAFVLAAATGKTILLKTGGNYVINTPVTISQNMRGEGRDTNQSFITLTGTGQLATGDEFCHWSGFTITSAVNTLTFVKVNNSHFKFDHFSIETVTATGQIGIEFATGTGLASCTLEHFRFNHVDYPVLISGTGFFNNNRLGLGGDHWQDFLSAIRTETTSTSSVNEVNGYFETGTNVISHDDGTLTGNTFNLWLDGVTNHLTTTVAVSNQNVWVIPTQTFTTAGAGAVTRQVIVGSVVSVDGLKFPAVQIADANVNTLDDYEEGTWTPVLTFVTPGNLNVVYSEQVGTYTKIGNLVRLSFRIATSTFTHTTASGAVNITGIPFSSGATYRAIGAMLFDGITKATYTQFALQILTSAAEIIIQASGSGVALASVTTADMPSGTQQTLVGSITYKV
mgnify:CR=1 FL=1